MEFQTSVASNAKRTALIVGCGYTGVRLGRRLLEMGLRVVGTSRKADRADTHPAGLELLTGDLLDPAVLAAIEKLKPSMVGYFVPPQRADDPLSRVLDAARSRAMEAFVYASSSSVYGDRAGEWVDETTPIVDSETGDPLRYAAERLMSEAGQGGVPTRVCRITGIYGPGRTLRGLLETGAYTLVEGHDVWVNRIHADDLVSGFLAAWQKGNNGAVYNMVDDRPHRASEFANLAADLNHLPRPAVISEAEARTRYAGEELRRKLASKRIRCARLRHDLGVQLKYPSYLTGLPASVARESG